MTATSTQPRAFRWALLLVALLALAVALANRPEPVGAAPDGPLDYLVDQYPGSEFDPIVLQVGDEIAFGITIWSPVPGGITNPLTYTMKKPTGMAFARYGHEYFDLLTGCQDNAPQAGYVSCTLVAPDIPPYEGWIIDKLYFRAEAAAAGRTYSGADITALFTDALSGFRDGTGTKLAINIDLSNPSFGGLTVANILGTGANITIATSANPPAVVEGQLSTVTVSFTHAFVLPIGPALQPIEAAVTNADVQTGSVTCPGGDVGTVVSNKARCSGSTIASGSTMTFAIRAHDTGNGADATVVLTAPSLGLTSDETGTAYEGSSRRTIIVDEVGLETKGAAPPWTVNSAITVCTANVLADVANDQAAGSAQSAAVFGHSTVPASQPLAQTDFVVTGPSGTVPSIYLDSSVANCGAGQSGLVFSPAAAGSYNVAARYNGDTTSATTLEATRGTNTLALAVETVNPLPAVSALSPNIAAQGQDGFTLTVTGSNFVAGSVIRWNGSERTTIFDSATQLRAIINAADISVAGTPSVTVANPAPGGGISGGVPFTVTTSSNPIPQVTSLAPNSVQAGTPGFTLAVKGTGFVLDSAVLWKGAARPTTYISATELRITLTDSDLATAGSIAVAVRNPVPGGGTSMSTTFTVTPAPGGGGDPGGGDDPGGGTPDNPVPTLATISPEAAAAGSADLTLTVTGTGFVSGSKVRWAGVDLATTFVSATQLTAVVPAAKLTSAGTAAVTVFSPTPGGGTSPSKTFAINETGPIETAELAVVVPGGLVSRSRLTFAATTGDLALTSVVFVIQRTADGKFWDGASGTWGDGEIENAAIASGGGWEYAVTGAARRQFVATEVEVAVHGTDGTRQYTGAEAGTLQIR